MTQEQFLLCWYLVGLIATIIINIVSGEFKLSDIMPSLFVSLAGPVLLFMGICIILEEYDKTIWRRK